MAHKASAFHLEKTSSAKGGKHQLEHNTREKPPRYLIGAKSGEIGFECNRELSEALALKEKMISEAKEAYERNRKGRARKFQATAYEWSAVCNLTNAHTMQDLENLAQKIHDKYGFQCYQISIHRDEGYLIDKKTRARLVSTKNFWLDNKTGIYYKDRAKTQILAKNDAELSLNYIKEINYHAHLEFITLDERTGKNRQADLNRAKLRELQTLVANELKMERGVDRRESKTKRIKPREYGERIAVAHNLTLKVEQNKQFNAELKENLANKDILLEKYRAEREAMKNSNEAIQSDYSKIKQLNEELQKQIKAQELTIENMNKKFAELQEELRKEREKREKAENDRARLAAELESKNAQNRAVADTKAAAPVQQKSAEVTHSAKKEQNILDKLSSDETKDLQNIAQKSKVCGWGVEKIENEMQKIHAWQIKDDYKAQSDYPQWGKIDTNESQLRDSLKKFTFWFAKKFKISEIRNFLGAVFEKEHKEREYEIKMAKLDEQMRKIDEALNKPKEPNKAEQIEQMKEQVKKHAYNQRETPKRDLGISR